MLPIGICCLGLKKVTNYIYRKTTKKQKNFFYQLVWSPLPVELLHSSWTVVLVPLFHCFSSFCTAPTWSFQLLCLWPLTRQLQHLIFPFFGFSTVDLLHCLGPSSCRWVCLRKNSAVRSFHILIKTNLANREVYGESKDYSVTKCHVYKISAEHFYQVCRILNGRSGKVLMKNMLTIYNQPDCYMSFRKKW